VLERGKSLEKLADETLNNGERNKSAETPC